jgi:hypothetical protein
MRITFCKFGVLSSLHQSRLKKRKASVQGFYGNASILTNATSIVDHYETQNEAFYDEITPLTSTRAYMVAAGNHESVRASSDGT